MLTLNSQADLPGQRKRALMGSLSVQIAGEAVLLPSGTPDQSLDPGDQLLAEHGAPSGGQRVLVLGAGNGVLPVFCARRVGQGEVLVVDQRSHALAVAAATAALNGATARFISTTDLSRLPAGSVNHALINIAFQPNSVRLVELLGETQRLTEPGARVYLAGARDRGADTAIKRLGEVFGRAQLAAYRKGYRVGVAVRSEAAMPPAAAPQLELMEVELRGSHYTLEAHSGVFARGGLDPAAALLATAIEVSSGDKVLDLGCGSGIVGMVAARLAPQGHVWLVDTNTEAVALTQRNVERNAIPNATVLVSDSTAAVADQRFDVVVCNPPFHEGRSAARSLGLRLINDAMHVLPPGGRCFVVANRFLPYETAMRERLHDVREVAGDTRYKVLRGSGLYRSG